jgi:anaerobic magnesium-protoporphyrin IX monomethyl ester cyclase
MEASEVEWSSLPQHLADDPPALVGIHTTTPVAHLVARGAEIVKASCPGAVLVIGGPHATLLPADVLNQIPQADYLLRGEAEYTLCDLVGRLSAEQSGWDLRAVPGIGFRQDGELFISDDIVRIEDLDALPLPAYDLLPLDRYFEGTRLVETGMEGRTFTMMSTRGCPNACSFCCESYLAGRKFRSRSPRNVVDEMELLVQKYDVSHIVFYDASFIDNAERVEGICREILDRHLEVTWRIRCRADRLTDSLAATMKKAGCIALAIGAESGSQQVLDTMHKRCTLAQIEQAFEIARRHGMWTVGYFILGMPGETREGSHETVEFAKRLDPDWALFTHATPLPGTELYAIAQDRLMTRDWSRFRFSANSPVLSYDGMDDAEMRRIMDDAFQSFYLRKEWLTNRLKKVRTPEQVGRLLDSFFHYLDIAVRTGGGGQRDSIVVATEPSGARPAGASSA